MFQNVALTFACSLKALCLSRVRQSRFAFRVFAKAALVFACSKFTLCFSRVRERRFDFLMMPLRLSRTREKRSSQKFFKYCFDIRVFSRKMLCISNMQDCSLPNMRNPKQTLLSPFLPLLARTRALRFACSLN